ncbi:putative membrane protein YGL010W [Bradyrhizobium sp. USDA 3397]
MSDMDGEASIMNSYFRRWLADYVEYHRAPWNCAMHVLGILFLSLAPLLPLSLWFLTASESRSPWQLSHSRRR